LTRPLPAWALLLAACARGDGSAQAPAAPEEPVADTDLELQRHLLGLNMRVPQQRFAEDAAWLAAHPDLALPALQARVEALGAEAARAATVLGRIGRVEAVPALNLALQQGLPTTRHAAALALGDMPGEAARQALAAALSSQDRDLVREAIEGLGRRREPQACAALQPLLQDSDAALRFYALRASAECGCLLEEEIRPFAEDEDEEVAGLARSLLGAK